MEIHSAGHLIAVIEFFPDLMEMEVFRGLSQYSLLHRGCVHIPYDGDVELVEIAHPVEEGDHEGYIVLDIRTVYPVFEGIGSRENNAEGVVEDRIEGDVGHAAEGVRYPERREVNELVRVSHDGAVVENIGPVVVIHVIGCIVSDLQALRERFLIVRPELYGDQNRSVRPVLECHVHVDIAVHQGNCIGYLPGSRIRNGRAAESKGAGNIGLVDLVPAE